MSRGSSIDHTPPAQFLVRAAAIVAGLTTLFVVRVHGAIYYVACTVVVLGVVSEAGATVAYWRRTRRRAP